VIQILHLNDSSHYTPTSVSSRKVSFQTIDERIHFLQRISQRSPLIPTAEHNNTHLASSRLKPLGIAVIMSTLTQDQYCPLLDLPVETLQRITGLIDPHEDLPVLRSTCKVLDDVSFNQFANASFSNLKCCIFSEARWLRLKEILGGPKRITSKIRDVEFTTHLFDRREKSELELLLNDDYSEIVIEMISEKDRARDHEETQASKVQHSPNVALMSSVIRDVQAVLPPQTVTLDLIQNLSSTNPYIEAHLHAILAVVAFQAQLRIGSLALNQDAISALLVNLPYLREDMLRCTSELKAFRIDYGRSDKTAERYWRAAVGKPLHHVYEILRSAAELRVVNLGLEVFMFADVAQPLLDSTVSSKLASLTLTAMKLNEEAFLEALLRHAPRLLTLSLQIIILGDVQDGWPLILRALSTMPRLNYLKLQNLIETHTDVEVPRMNLRLSSKTSGPVKPWEPRIHEGRMIVSSGLGELLAEPLVYMKPDSTVVGQRGSDSVLHLV
jgi:hypothetical protein